ncbi:MAG: hypothetical protein ACI9SC_002152 [Gammaproteobacteria bacterium]|jgi:hypothetical protein
MIKRRTILKTGLAIPVLSALNARANKTHDNESESSNKGTDMQEGVNVVDHFMWAAVDLESASAEFERLTGVRPAFGGRHIGFGTHNSLVSLSNGSYMEVLALDPEQDDKGPIGAEIALLESPAILAFHIKRADLEGVVRVYEEMNIPYTGPFDLSRQRPDGEVLRWRLLLPGSPVFKHALPVFIDWMEAPHPSMSAPTGCTLTHFEVGHPKDAELISLYEKLDVSLPVVHSKEAYAKATLNTPKGKVVLHGLL